MIVCLRTGAVPPDVRSRHLQGIADGRADAWIATPGLADQPDSYPTTEDTP